MRRLTLIPLALAAAVVLIPSPRPVLAYVEAPMSLGAIIQQSVVVCSMVVTKVDKQKNLVIFRKVQDFKGKHPQDEIKHNIGFGGLRPGEWQEIMNWAEVGKPAMFFHNGGASETYTGTTWYQAYPQGEWWGMSHGEPFLMRSYSGKVDKLGPAVADIVAGKEVIVPCMVDGDKEALHKKTAKVQRLRASMKLLDYNPKRDFTGWGGEDIRRLAGMGGFDRLAALGNTGPDTQAASAVDFDGDGKLDVCLVGPTKLLLLANNGDGFAEVTLPNFTGGARAAVWADHDGDGKPDLLLATPNGPRLFTNRGAGQFRDDTALLPVEPCYNLTAAAWLDADGDGFPDVLLANGFHGLRLYKNGRTADAAKGPAPPKLGDWYAVGPFRHKDGPAKNAATAFGPEADPFDPARPYKGKRDAEVKWEKRDYKDGESNALSAFGENCAVYFHRELDSAAAQAWATQLACGGALRVWLNGEQIFDAAEAKAVPLVLNLKAGKNRLVAKACQLGGEWAFAFGGAAGGASGPKFADVSAAWLPNDLPKGDTLTVADFTGDGKPDVLYGAGDGLLFTNTGGRFEAKADSGIAFKAGKVGPAAEDFDGDGLLDLFVPQPGGGCKLFRNTGGGKFADITAAAGDLARPIPGAVGAAWGDFDNDGRADLAVTCLRGTNRYFRNDGGGKFTDQSAAVGLTQKVFNSQAACFADLNADGRLDLILANEGQEATALFGSLATDAKRVPVTVYAPGAGAVVTVSANGAKVAGAVVGGGDGRGGQAGLAPRFALAPGAYTVEVRGGGGGRVEKAITVGTTAVVVR